MPIMLYVPAYTTWVDPATGKSNINHRHLPQMQITEHLHNGTRYEYMLYLIQK